MKAESMHLLWIIFTLCLGIGMFTCVGMTYYSNSCHKCINFAWINALYTINMTHFIQGCLVFFCFAQIQYFCISLHFKNCFSKFQFVLRFKFEGNVVIRVRVFWYRCSFFNQSVTFNEVKLPWSTLEWCTAMHLILT